MSFKRLVLAVTFLAVFAMALRVSIDSDTWWQLRAGESIVRGGEIPKTDSFSYTRNGESWLYPSAAWLSEAQLYLLMIGFGPGALNLWVALLVVVAFAFIYISISGGIFLKAFVTVLAVATSAVYWAARPYMWSFVFTAVFLWILEDWRWGRRNRLWWLPVIMLVWANSHPGFAVGFILLAIYAADRGLRWAAERWQTRRLKRKDAVQAWRDWAGTLTLVALAMVLAVCINPYGPTMLRYPFDTVNIGVLRDYIQEWQSPDFHQLNVLPFAILLLLTIGVLGLSKKRIVVSDLLLVAVFAGMSLLAGRNIALFALAAPIVLSRHAEPLMTEASKVLRLPRPRSKPFRGQSALHWTMLAALLIVVGVKAAPILRTDSVWALLRPNLPAGAVDYMEEHNPPGKLFNSYNWGGYLIWRAPHYPVYIDGRTDLYADDLLTEWLSIVSAEDGWQEKLEGRDVRLVLLEPDRPLSKLLAANDWTLLYQDEISVLYAKP